ncbi:hypothetical protein KSC_002470 [Ktedonobacter sp. SOSP1-52]|uniref:protein DpdG n=1 Tax=Ktedonobacter sp. SOSP1-52 TaxID=2778366 RepID=UPI0019161418|nr:protein DpdG [Ktedonobacter sp. SOSP1-52]GHO61355.1 hypothetical protein KSC_002470 [Ktedonobacter sp. SOSP1-52]
MEIINDARIEWRRLWALARLVADLETSTQQEIFDLLQPQVLTDKSAAATVAGSTTAIAIRQAIDIGLLQEREDKTISLGVSSDKLASESAFRDCMRDLLLGVTERHRSNYLFNLFSAWYAVQDTRVFYELAEQKYFPQFNADMSPSQATDDQRLFNDTKLNGWRKWAVFLGLGWSMRFNGREVVVPDATGRLRAALPAIFQEGEYMTLEQFIERLGRACPELDGGKLFTLCWQASRGSDVQGNRLSLMLSTGLRTLDRLQSIRLEYQADSLSVWQLYPAQGSVHQQLTHIEYLGG